MPGAFLKPAAALSALTVLYADVDREASRLHILHAARSQCRRGCSGCCVDELTIFVGEAAPIRLRHAALLASGEPHPVGACAFLDAEGACRIYAERPYVCRTQGLPMRWLEEEASSTVELRDICPLNETDEPVTELPADSCWTLGPIEERLAHIQIASRELPIRIALRALFSRA